LQALAEAQWAVLSGSRKLKNGVDSWMRRSQNVSWLHTLQWSARPCTVTGPNS
jgi:hypothetical protein